VEDILTTAAHVTFYQFNTDANQWVSEWVNGGICVGRFLSAFLTFDRGLSALFCLNRVCRGASWERFVKEEGRGWGSLLLSHSPWRVSPFRRPWVMMARATGLRSSMYARRSAYAIYHVKGSKENIRVVSFLKLREGLGSKPRGERKGLSGVMELRLSERV
jgi:hypothetical protein